MELEDHLVSSLNTGWRGLYLSSQCSCAWALHSSNISYERLEWKGETSSRSRWENELQEISNPKRHRWGLIESQPCFCCTNIPSEVTFCSFCVFGIPHGFLKEPIISYLVHVYFFYAIYVEKFLLIVSHRDWT